MHGSRVAFALTHRYIQSPEVITQAAIKSCYYHQSGDRQAAGQGQYVPLLTSTDYMYGLGPGGLLSVILITWPDNKLT